MAYDEYLADRMRDVLHEKHVIYDERKMMGGLCFMVQNKICMGIVDDTLMARIGPDAYDDALKKEGCVEMDFTGRPMKGFVFVQPEAIDASEDLEYWIDLCLAFNPLANSSKKKK